MAEAIEDAVARPARMRWKLWSAAVILAIAAFAAAGYGLVPWLIRTQLPEQVAKQTGHRASVGDVRFDPFALRLEARDLGLADPEGAPLLSLKGLTVDFEWSSITRRAWVFALLRLESPQAHLAIAPDGRFNLARFIEAFKTEPSKDDALPRLKVARIELAGGRVDFDDRRAGYRNSLAPIEFALDGLSTLPEEKGPYTLSADTARGGRIRWKGEAALNPIRGSGTLVLESIALPELSTYLKPFVDLALEEGRLAATLPYRFSYEAGKPGFALEGAGLALNGLKGRVGGQAGAGFALGGVALEAVSADLAAGEATVGALRLTDTVLALPGAKTPALTLPKLAVEGVKARQAGPRVEVATVALKGGQLDVRRDAKGAIDWLALAGLGRGAPAPAAATPAAPAPGVPQPSPFVAITSVSVEDLGLAYADATSATPLEAGIAHIGLKGQVAIGAADASPLLRADLSVADIRLGPKAQPVLKAGALSVAGIVFGADSSLTVERVSLKGAQTAVRIDAHGKPDLLGYLPGSGAATTSPAATGTPPTAPKVSIKTIEAEGLVADVSDASTGIALRAEDGRLKLAGVTADASKPVGFEAGFRLREGGAFKAAGKVVPATGALDTTVGVERLALAIAQPLLARHVKLNVASGSASADGRLVVGGKDAKLRYAGNARLADLLLAESDGKPFAALKGAEARGVTLSLGPDALEIPELQLDSPKAQLLIAADRSLNAARLLVAPPAAASPASAPTAGAVKPAPVAPAPAAAPPAPLAAASLAAAPPTAASTSASTPADSFPVAVRRLAIRNAELEFEDLSLRPPFGAKIHELSGVITGLSTNAATRSKLELDGRVDEFGLARIRGDLNPFFPRVATDVALTFRNIDLTRTSPYAMKFAGYRIAAGRLSLTLGYKVRDGQLQGDNQVVLDQLTLGERVDSPDALKLPLELAIAILKDSDGRIDLDLPVSGSLDDPQFSYGGIIWKAIVNVVTRIVTAPFRALGNLFGGDGAKFEAIAFDPGSARVTPPELEKLKAVAQALAKRAQLKLSVPGAYSEALDAPVLRETALRAEVLRRAGLRVAEGEAPGPLDYTDRAQRVVLRTLFIERFGVAALDALRAQAEQGTLANPRGAKPAPVPVWRRALNIAQGEPNVPDAEAFHAAMTARLAETWPMAPDALARLGAARAAAVDAALKAAGVDAARYAVAGSEAVATDARLVPLKFGLAAR
jgi:hypothetical protein